MNHSHRFSLHRDAYVLGHGFGVFYTTTLGEKLFVHEMKPIEYATILKKNLWYKHKTIACTPTFMS